VLGTPGHTCGHIVFTVLGESGTEEAAFTGDALFVSGIGAQFEAGLTGDARTVQTLNKLASLPASCKLFVGHEYAENGVWFAAWLEHQNAAVVQHAHWVTAQRAANRSCVPSTVAIERQTNPFLRLSNPELQRALQSRLEELESFGCYARVCSSMPDGWSKTSLVGSWQDADDQQTASDLKHQDESSLVDVLHKLHQVFARAQFDFRLTTSTEISVDDTSCKNWQAREAIFTEHNVYFLA